MYTQDCLMLKKMVPREGTAKMGYAMKEETLAWSLEERHHRCNI